MRRSNTIFLISIIAFAGACIDYSPKQIEKDSDERPIIVADPEWIDFGAIGEDQMADEYLSIGNKGNQALEVSDIELRTVGAFQLTFPSPIETIAPGEWAELIVSYQPMHFSDSTQLDIHSNDLNVPILTVPIQGETTYPMLQITPNPHAFNWTEVGSQSEGSIDLSSTGQVPVTVESVLMIGDAFSMTDLTFPITIEPGDSISLPVFFSPVEELNYEGEIWVQSDSISNPTKGTLFGYSGAGSISGRICDPSGEGWVSNARVYISIDSNEDGIEDFRIETLTDGDGYYLLEGVIAGSHTIHVEKGSFSTEFHVEFPGGNYEMTTDECLDPKSVNIAVVSGEFDSIEGILADLDLEYELYGAHNYLELLRSPEELAEYDIIFFNCGMPFDWLDERALVTTNLKEFVEEGGSIYGSDWAYGLIEATWPHAIDFYGDDSKLIDPFFADEEDIRDTPFVGMATDIYGYIPSETMSDAIGSNYAELYYDLDAWVVPVQVGSGAATLVEGDAMTWDFWSGGFGDTVEDAPLAIEFSPGGRVIFTTFHNEYQMTNDMETALKEIILSL